MAAVVIHMISEYDPESSKVRHSPYKLQKLPDSYLSNIFNGASSSANDTHVAPASTMVIDA